MMAENENRIIGVAGMNPDGCTISNLRYQGDGSYITRQRLNTPTCVTSLDECLFAVSKSLLSKLKFDKMNCFHWTCMPWICVMRLYALSGRRSS